MQASDLRLASTLVAAGQIACLETGGREPSLFAAALQQVARVAASRTRPGSVHTERRSAPHTWQGRS